MVEHIEKRATSVSHIPNGITESYDVNLKVMLINHVIITNISNAANKFQVSAAASVYLADSTFIPFIVFCACIAMK
jgi:hypothetical protein